jgi:Zn-finger nucleic acid-binding protein
MSDRLGVEIDYCPKCRGVWLDRGELDKIIEKSSSKNQSGYIEDKFDYKTGNDRYSYDRKKRKESFLEDLFDF